MLRTMEVFVVLLLFSTIICLNVFQIVVCIFAGMGWAIFQKGRCPPCSGYTRSIRITRVWFVVTLDAVRSCVVSRHRLGAPHLYSPGLDQDIRVFACRHAFWCRHHRLNVRPVFVFGILSRNIKIFFEGWKKQEKQAILQTFPGLWCGDWWSMRSMEVCFGPYFYFSHNLCAGRVDNDHDMRTVVTYLVRCYNPYNIVSAMRHECLYFHSLHS